MELVSVGSEMKAVMDAVVEYRRAATDRLYEDMGELIEVLNERDEEIEDLMAVIEVLVNDNRQLMEDNVKLVTETEFLSSSNDYLRNRLRSAEAQAEEIERSFTVSNVRPKKHARPKPECCSAGHCGTDKCGGNCQEKDEVASATTVVSSLEEVLEFLVENGDLPNLTDLLF